jgi:hypothetical protein
MGTNFYLKTSVCSSCGRGDKDLHIGKSSFGWAFSLHVDPENGIKDLPDWERLFSNPSNVIIDEYRRAISVTEMLDTITNRKGNVLKDGPAPGYKSKEEMLERNFAVLDEKHGLLRSDKDRPESRCIGHGSGPWDLVTGEFS